MAAGNALGGRRAPVLETLADLYEQSTQGRTGASQHPYGLRWSKLLQAAECESGERLENALADARALHGQGVVLVINRRTHEIDRITVPLTHEAGLFRALGRRSPTELRAEWCALFSAASAYTVPPEFAPTWAAFCQARTERAQQGRGWAPFQKYQLKKAQLLLEVVARLLAWRQPALLRTASVQLTGSSKFLEQASGALLTLLAEAIGGRLTTFADLHIEGHPQSFIFHGPVALHKGGTAIHYGSHAGALSLSYQELLGAERIECTAPRCITVENATTFHELSRLHPGDLFVLTSYPNRATVEFLRRLPTSLPRFHFGDTDPWGFDVLRALRRELHPLPIAPLHMRFRPGTNLVPLTPRDARKLQLLLADDNLLDVRPELERMQQAGSKGQFEQEALPLGGSGFPYTAEVAP